MHEGLDQLLGQLGARLSAIKWERKKEEIEGEDKCNDWTGIVVSNIMFDNWWSRPTLWLNYRDRQSAQGLWSKSLLAHFGSSKVKKPRLPTIETCNVIFRWEVMCLTLATSL